MSEATRLLKGIMKSSGWTQEQVSMKLGVSFATMNSWINGRSRPRKAMMESIRKLYLAQDITRDAVPTFVTLVNVGGGLRVGDAVLLTKDTDNEHDDEAIMASVLDFGSDGEDVFGDDSMDEESEEELCGIRVIPEYISEEMYVANSVNTVVRGTKSSGRIYDRFEKSARAQVLFVFHRMAIARIVEWNYEE